jgi:AraC family transcriptional regulator
VRVTQTERLYGEVVRSRALNEVILCETAYPSGLQLPTHSHERPYFCFVLHGSYRETFGTQDRLCQPSSLIFHPGAEIHSDRFYTEAGCFNVQVEASLLRRVGEYSMQFDAPFHSSGGAPAFLAMKIYREFRIMDGASSLAIEGLLLELMAEVSRHSFSRIERSSSTPYWLIQARNILRDRFPERITLAEIAESVHVHPVHLAREFRKRYSCTVGEYVRELRIDFACRKLSQSKMSLVEVGLVSGFSNQSHFSRAFKQHTGMTPAQYRMISQSR